MYPMRKKRSKRVGPVRPTKGPPAEDLELFLAFLNAVDSGSGTGELATPRGLLDWLMKRGLASTDEEISATQLERAREACVGLRALIAEDAGAPADAGALEKLHRLTPATTIHLGSSGLSRLVPTSSGVDGVIERLFAIAIRSRFENLWPRFKICTDPTCRRVYYDESRNLRARWCSPRCGNRYYTRDYRRRRKG